MSDQLPIRSCRQLREDSSQLGVAVFSVNKAKIES